MSLVYRKSLKGIDEVAFKSTGLPLRMMSYLLLVDGESSVDLLVTRNSQLPSIQIVLQGLCEQGFLEIVGNVSNVVSMGAAQTANSPPTQTQPSANPPVNRSNAHSFNPSGYSTPNAFVELEKIKTSMAQEVSSILGADAAQVVRKIQLCQTKDDLFSTMMGVKKIITVYTDRNTAEKFAARYQILSM
jgi:hypothetical protein